MYTIKIRYFSELLLWCSTSERPIPRLSMYSELPLTTEITACLHHFGHKCRPSSRLDGGMARNTKQWQSQHNATKKQYIDRHSAQWITAKQFLPIIKTIEYPPMAFFTDANNHDSHTLLRVLSSAACPHYNINCWRALTSIYNTQACWHGNKEFWISSGNKNVCRRCALNQLNNQLQIRNEISNSNRAF